MLYAKIVNSKIEYAPSVIDGVEFPDESVYVAHGFLPVEPPTLPPQENYVFTPRWVEDDGKIHMEWERGEEIIIPPADSMYDKAEAYDILTGAIQ